MMIMNNPVVQDVFNKVIDGRYYNSSSNRFMCDALFYTEVWGGIISEEEYNITRNDIHQFIRLFTNSMFLSLNDILRGTEYHRNDGVYIDIYRDWFKFKEEFIKKYLPIRNS